MSSFRDRISDILVAQDLATKEQVAKVMAEAARNGKSFARLLIERGVVPEAKLTEVLSRELGLPMISLAKYRIDPAVAETIPERPARQNNLSAPSRRGERRVGARGDPLNIFAIADLKGFTQGAIDPV